MTITALKTNSPEQILQSLFAQQANQSASQSDAIARVLDKGAPTRRTERWRYTPLRKVFSPDMAMSADSIAQVPSHPALEKLSNTVQLTILNGQVHGKIDSADIQVNVTENATSVNPLKHQDTFIDDLNIAFCNKVIHIKLAGLLESQLVIHLHHSLLNALQATRLEISCADNCDAKILLLHTSDSASQSTLIPVTILTAGQNSDIELIHVQDLGSDSNQLGKSHFQIHRDAVVTFTQLELGGQLVRHDVVADVLEPGAEFNVSELMHTTDKQHHDTHLDVYHHAEHTQSTMQVKAVLDDKSRGVFNGKIYVEKDAQQINANLNNDNLLLSQYAEINTKPELEIYADDVKCAHGATVGQLDEQALFYLRSRGIDPDEAEKILIAAFSRSTYQALVPQDLEHWLDQRLGFKA
ncbi:MAG: Fe-S cluster assembly protein SufD [Gammaproteobacteria bacterium]|nr:Fe-S cluster assembly protein SufD [Gammaproteobacteria bacterium]NNC97441.1 Fe-S cluster assembly protein SufD [Gammaproteobacteria bacterium]NNM13914.1 Fe-S cluster assembly protein SufD [Gammaproteobacteria bacterium]